MYIHIFHEQIDAWTSWRCLRHKSRPLFFGATGRSDSHQNRDPTLSGVRGRLADVARCSQWGK